MPKFDLIIFDLDGTLVDSSLDLANSTNQMLSEFDLPLHSVEKIKSFIGNGAKKLIERSLPKDSEISVEKALNRFQEVYKEKCLENTNFFPQVRETILQISGIPLGVLSNKPDKFTKEIIRSLGLFDNFDFVYGADYFGLLKPNPELIEKIKGDAKNILYVGDSIVDLTFAQNSKVSSCIVTYGLGNLEEIRKLEPDFLIDDFEELLKILDL
ncbi:MAG: HAD family hydrolase [Calditrichaeota bacterium]|nr:MAG: HAD family hydrolase [Calditrichota bacterium]